MELRPLVELLCGLAEVLCDGRLAGSRRNRRDRRGGRIIPLTCPLFPCIRRALRGPGHKPGSMAFGSSNGLSSFWAGDSGGVSRAAKGADCKSAGFAFVGSSPTSPTIAWGAGLAPGDEVKKDKKYKWL